MGRERHGACFTEGMRARLLAASLLPLATLTACAARSDPPAPAVTVPGRWAASEGLRITVFGGPDGPVTLTRGHRDWKPVWSPRGGLLAFFRTSKDLGSFVHWQADLWVVRADGGGARQLTAAKGRDFNPTWTRDGTDRILFNRYGVGGEPDRCEVWMTSSDAAPGSEVRISSPAHRFEWANAGLRDGRVFVDTIEQQGAAGVMRSWLLTPAAGGGAGRYEEVARPTGGLWHKLSVSPSETKVAYMLDQAGDLADYSDDLLYWAELDRDGRAVRRPTRITGPTGRRCVNEYPRWSADETLVLFDSSCSGVPRVYAYRLSDGAVAPVSPRTAEPVMFPCAEGVPQ